MSVSRKIAEIAASTSPSASQLSETGPIKASSETASSTHNKDSPSIVIPVGRLHDNGLSTGGSTLSGTSWSSPKNTTPPSSVRGKAPSVHLQREVSSNSTGTQGSNVSGESNASKYDPSWYLSLIGEGTAAIAAYCQTDRELQKQLSDIRTMLQNKDDWELRFTGLGRLQGLVSELSWSGVGPDIIVSSIRSMLAEPVSMPENVIFWVKRSV